MKVFFSEIILSDGEGQEWRITCNYNAPLDELCIRWGRSKVLWLKADGGLMIPRRESEDPSLVTVDNLPGCIMNTVQLLCDGQTKEIKGVKFSPVSKFPLSPTGKTLLGYLDMMRTFQGFTELNNLVKTIEFGEDFLNTINIPVTIKRSLETLAA